VDGTEDVPELQPQEEGYEKETATDWNARFKFALTALNAWFTFLRAASLTWLRRHDVATTRGEFC
jgi:hypothetical protein